MSDEMVNMRTFLLVMGVFVIAACFAEASNLDYFVYDDFRGTWADAEKDTLSTEDDNMCWAAAASNVLEWTGWTSPNLTRTDQIFSYFQDHWTDAGGRMNFGWDWWFDGSYNGPMAPTWSSPDVPIGGFFTTVDFSEYFHQAWNPSGAMSIVDEYLHNGYGTGLGLYNAGRGHAITVWGFQYDPDMPDYYTGIYITDSDDSMNGPSPRPDSLRYYDLTYANAKWYLQNYGGGSAWYITDIQAMSQNPGFASNPEPSTILLFSLGSLALLKKKQPISGKPQFNQL
jgi:hypothetical protein